MMREISLDNKDFFEIFIGERVLKKQVFNSKGKIPLFSANVFKPFGYVEKSNISEFKRDYVLWGIDGNFEFSIQPKGKVFATTDHCGAIRILNNSILPEYVLYQLEIKKYELGFDRTLRASLTNMRSININIPIKENGDFDEARQSVLIRKYRFLSESKKELDDRINELREALFEIQRAGRQKRVILSELFDFPETNTHVTKSFCEKNKGTIPVYGCSKSEDAVLGFIKPNLNGIKFYEDSLTWNRNGSVGYFFIRDGVFTTNEDHRVIEIKPKYKKQLSLLYLKYVLQNEVRKLGFMFTNKLGKAKIENIEIPVPITEKGEFDLTTQEAIAKDYAKLYQIKENIIQNLLALTESVVVLE